MIATRPDPVLQRSIDVIERFLRFKALVHGSLGYLHNC